MTYERSVAITRTSIEQATNLPTTSPEPNIQPLARFTHIPHPEPYASFPKQIGTSEIVMQNNAAGNTVWLRNGKERLVQFRKSDPNRTSTGYIVSHLDLLESRPAYSVTVENGRIKNDFIPWKDADGTKYRTHDLNKDGEYDVFEIISAESNATLEAIVLINGVLELVPASMFVRKSGQPAYLDQEALAAFLEHERSFASVDN